jgi:Holliday junction resolvase RusA-like endonuclease
MIVFDLPLPPSVNSLYLNKPGVGRIKAPSYRLWCNEAGLEAKIQKLGWDYQVLAAWQGIILDQKYRLTIDVPENMRGDIDNRNKAVLDLLVNLGLTPDDRHCQSVTVRRSAKIPKDRCHVWISVHSAEKAA